jgi:hypothetical protein
LAALTAIIDTCALVMAGLEGACERQAELTFAMARHAVVDLCLVFRTGPRKPAHNRLPPERLAELRATLATAGIKLQEREAADLKLVELRGMYEPYIDALATYFQVGIPPWIAAERRPDNWQGNIQAPRSAAGKVTRRREKGEHF